MQDLKTFLIQTSLHWEDQGKNLEIFDHYIQQVDQQADLIVLPEMFSTGFTMNAAQCSEPAEGTAFQWMQQKAVEYQCVITGSVLTEDGGRFYNRMYWVRPDGSYDYYDKRHLFRMGNEHKTMTQGNIRKIVELKGWKINLQVCYDLRFPVWSRNRFRDGEYDFDLLVYVANWPAVRRNAYLPLLQARAIENQSCLLWVNRVGKDGNGVDHAGDSMGIDARGQIIRQAHKDQTEILEVTLSARELKTFRNKFQVGRDWDDFEVK